MIFAIESSCDDSSIALMGIDTLELKYHRKISQETQHSLYGGVVPELASRLHTEALPALLEGLKPYFTDIRAVAVTNTPGLSVSLLPGLSMAKAVALALNIPIIGVNHLIGHIYSLFLQSEIYFGFGVLLVSGGHTMVLDIDETGKIEVLAATSDDSFGESFDKVAKMLGFGYPGGAFIQNSALECDDKDKFKFTVPLLHDKRLEYSFSGLKNQVRLACESAKSKNGNIDKQDVANISYTFEQTACAHIIDKLSRVFKQKQWKRFGVVGGASANLNLRNQIEILCKSYDCELLLAPLEYCSDNAAMIARAGIERLKRGEFGDIFSIDAKPRSSIDGFYV